MPIAAIQPWAADRGIVLEPGMHDRPAPSLSVRLDLDSHSCVALIGAGGKTTTMMALAGELTSAGRRTIVTTSTKIWPPAGVPVVLRSAVDDLARAVEAALARSPLVALGGSVNERGKLTGVDPADLCGLRREKLGVLLVEADGAARRPLKVHGDHEPVVPACATHVLLLAGMDACEGRVDGDTVHRLEAFVQRAAARIGDRITPEHILRALELARERVPRGPRLTVILNKVDNPVRREAAECVASRWRGAHPEEVVLLAVQGMLRDPVVQRCDR